MFEKKINRLKNIVPINGSMQSGGLAFLPALAAVHAVGSTVKPGTKLKNFLDSDTLNGHRDNIGYKVVNGIANGLKSIGWGTPQVGGAAGYPGGYPSSTGVGTVTFTPVVSKSRSVVKKRKKGKKKGKK